MFRTGRATVAWLVLLLAPLARGDDTPRIAALLAPAVKSGGVVTIPPGDYRLDGATPLPIPSRTTVLAHGARFLLPERLGDRARVVLFEGTDVAEFAWHGGTFVGHVFDPDRRENAWEPNANTRGFVIRTSKAGGTRDLLFRDVRSEDVAGAVVTVEGRPRPGSESAVDAPAERVAVEGCTLLRSGKFMWDYGCLWQQVVWPEDYEPWEVERARRYFRNDLVREAVRLADGDDRVRLDNRERPIGVSRSDHPAETVCFFGGPLPRNIVRGRQYAVVASGPDFLQVAERPGEPPIRFEGSAGAGVGLIRDLQAAFYALYQPTGAGPGKGAIDLVGCRDVRVSGCRLSALGDTMHIQRSEGIVFAGNQILGSRMGAFFLAEFCRDATVTGNLVDGTNGSRVMSVEKSCANVTIVGNTFRNGGRGSWINQPRGLVLAGNVFEDNTTKCEFDPRRGRRSPATGGWEQYPELYVTRYREDQGYGPVIVRDNLFTVAPSCGPDALTLAGGGDGLHVRGNVFRGAARGLRVEPGSTDVTIEDNSGLVQP